MASLAWMLCFPSAVPDAGGANAKVRSKLLYQETKTPKVLLIRACWNSHPTLVFQLSSLKASWIQNIWKAHRETGGGRGVEVKISIMKIFQSFFSFLLQNAEIGVRRLTFFLFIIPLFYFLPFPSPSNFGKVTEWQNSTAAFFSFVLLWKFYREGFFFPQEWGKENVKENIPKKT